MIKSYRFVSESAVGEISPRFSLLSTTTPMITGGVSNIIHAKTNSHSKGSCNSDRSIWHR